MRDTASPSSAGTSVGVDFDALRRMAAALRGLASQLAVGDTIDQPELDSDLFGRLRSVESDWTSHRRQLQSFLSDTAVSLEQIVAQYEKTDDMIAAAAKP